MRKQVKFLINKLFASWRQFTKLLPLHCLLAQDVEEDLVKGTHSRRRLDLV